MVQVFAPKPMLPSLPLFFNVDSSVGRNGQNSSTDDIMLVQYFMKLIGQSSAAPELRTLANISVTGRMNDATIAGIEAVQRSNKSVADGRVSVAQGYRFGGNFFTVVSLNFNIKERFAAKWPNADELPDCPPLLNLACRRALVGTTR